uniref:CCHC-type domain-containing protein n=1 Tax=Tanacetum cinerariifolium TaxID=118510 RepID=A0A699GY13_TANCI|nr:hypothetical protein [Tanacetum cinerariifolium]
MKARGTLLMALPNKDQLKFHSYQDAKLLMEAIKKRYGGNKESKKVQRTLLKQQYKNFTASSLETLYQTFDMLQKLISLLELQGEEMAMLTIRARRLMKRTGRSLDINGQRIGFDKTNSKCFNCHKNGHFARECRALRNQDNKGREYGRKTVLVETPIENALIAQDGIGGYDWSYQAEEETPINYAFMALTSLRSSSSSNFELLEKQNDRSTKRYHEVPPPLTGNYMPPKRDLRLIDEHFDSESVDVSTVSSSADKTIKTVDITHKDDSEDELSPTVEVKTVKQSVKKIEYVKTLKETVLNRSTKINTAVESVNTAGNLQQKEYKEKGVIDNGCSRHMTRNKCYLTDFEAFDGGFVSFGDRKGRISGKATLDESNLWHRRLDHINFKTMNKLVKGNLIRGLPSKIFQDDNSYVACQKGKQHKASYKAKLLNTISKPLHMLHMDLFGPTNVKSLMKKSYCLVITDDFSRFSWVFFLAIKGETSGILKTFILGIENQLDCKVKVIRSDNRTKFKNSVMTQFYDDKEKLVAGQDEKKKELEQEYILIPICTTGPLISQDAKDSAEDAGKKAPGVDAGEASDNGGQDIQVSKISNDGPSFVNAASQIPLNIIGPSASTNAFEEHYFERFSPYKNAFSLPHVLMVTLIDDTGIFGNAYDDVLEEEVDINNTLVDLPKDKWTVVTKWVYKNKKDERGIVIENKARLVAQGHTQEEGINYDEVFALVARIKAIRLFLACASFKDFIVYQMDVKSAFLHGKIEDEVYVRQPHSFKVRNFPDKVYKVEKALYRLHQAPRAWYETLSTYLLDNGFYKGQINKTLFIKRHKDDILKSDGIFIIQDKYVAEILKKFNFVPVKTANTPMESNKPLIKNKEAEDVDVHLYRSMIGSLMYLTTSRHDITFVVYLKGQPKLGLWYPKDSPFDLEAYSDSDYTRASLDKKSTTGDKTVHKEREDRMEKAATTTSSLEAELLVVKMKNRQSDMVSKRNERINKEVKGMARHKEMYIISSHTKKIFANTRRIKAGFSGVITPLFDTMMVQAAADMGDTLVETHQTPIVDQPSTFRPQKKQKPRRKQRKEAEVSDDESEDEDHVPTPSSDPLPSGEDSYTLNELMVFCTSLQEHVFGLQEAKDAQSKEIVALKKKEDASKQGRIIEEIDQDDKIALNADTQGRKNDDEMFGVDDLSREEVVLDTTTDEHEEQIIKDVSTAEPVTTADEVLTTVAEKVSAALTTDVIEDEIIMAQALTALKSTKPKVVVQEQEQSHIPTVSLSKDKGKAKLIEPEFPIKKNDQMRMDEEYARPLEAEEQKATRLLAMILLK